MLFFFNKDICCDPSLELSHRDSSNEGSQNMLFFFFENYIISCYSLSGALVLITMVAPSIVVPCWDE